jgi:two-component system, chemotaxis family, response regulator Rcp1
MSNSQIRPQDKAIQILLVEDNPADAKLLTSLFEPDPKRYQFAMVSDGEKALTYLKLNAQNEKSRPDLILLDLNLPKIDGKEVLKKVRSNASLRTIPVLILTTSDRDEDVRTCYELGANCFLTKPTSLEELTSLFQALQDFWIKHVNYARMERH